MLAIFLVPYVCARAPVCMCVFQLHVFRFPFNQRWIRARNIGTQQGFLCGRLQALIRTLWFCTQSCLNPAPARKPFVIRLLETSVLFLANLCPLVQKWSCPQRPPGNVTGHPRTWIVVGLMNQKTSSAFFSHPFSTDHQWKTWRVSFPRWHHRDSWFLASSESSWWPLRLNKHFCTNTHNVRSCGFVVVMPYHSWKPLSVPPDMK